MSPPSDSTANHFEFRPPDVLVIRGRYRAAAVNLEKTAQELRALGEKTKYYLLIDCTGVNASVLTPELRENAPKIVDSANILGCAYINASTPIRLALKVLTLGLFLAGKSDFPTEFVASEEAGLATIERWRSEASSRATG